MRLCLALDRPRHLHDSHQPVVRLCGILPYTRPHCGRNGSRHQRNYFYLPSASSHKWTLIVHVPRIPRVEGRKGREKLGHSCSHQCYNARSEPKPTVQERHLELSRRTKAPIGMACPVLQGIL